MMKKRDCATSINSMILDTEEIEGRERKGRTCPAKAGVGEQGAFLKKICQGARKA
jgi:hypothetical protein